jgi:hypothetical protein
MTQERFGRKVLWVGAVAAAAYFALFAWIEHGRNRQGPWEVAFTRHTNGLPCLEISQPALGVRDVRIVFPEALTSNTASLPVKQGFGEARATPFDLPFGRCVFLDTISLPGTVAIEVGGRQVQLLPRVLTVDGRERPWRNSETLCLEPRTSGVTALPEAQEAQEAQEARGTGNRR